MGRDAGGGLYFLIKKEKKKFLTSDISFPYL